MLHLCFNDWISHSFRHWIDERKWLLKGYWKHESLGKQRYRICLQSNIGQICGTDVLGVLLLSELLLNKNMFYSTSLLLLIQTKVFAKKSFLHLFNSTKHRNYFVSFFLYFVLFSFFSFSLGKTKLVNKNWQLLKIERRR